MTKIMLVEDDQTMLTLLQTLLEMEGFQVIKSRDGKLEEILGYMIEEKPALALIDVNLRQVNGFDLLKEIRKDENLKSMQVLMTSGMDYAFECRDAGADYFILKPYMPDELIRVIHQLLNT